MPLIMPQASLRNLASEMICISLWVHAGDILYLATNLTEQNVCFGI